jgi:hypothetical protein
MHDVWAWWRIADLVALVAYVIYVLVTGNGPRRLFLASAGAFVGTLTAVAVIAGVLVLFIR